MLIEQALWITDEQGRDTLVASPGLGADCSDRLKAWRRERGRLIDEDSGSSIDFFRVPGAYAIVETFARQDAPRECRSLSRALIVPEAVFARFANNPFAVLDAAYAQGLLSARPLLHDVLPSFTLSGRAEAFDRVGLGSMLFEPGCDAFALLVDRLVRDRQLALPAGAAAVRLMSALVQCIPVECRPELTFSTGFDATGCWSTAVRAAPPLSAPAPAEMPTSSIEQGNWSRLVEQVLDEGLLAWFSAALRVRRPGLSWAMLDALADELKGQLIPSADLEAPAPAGSIRAFHGPMLETPASVVQQAWLSDETGGDCDRTAALAAARALCVAPSGDETVDRLEQLDDVVFEAIAGKPGAIELVQELWPALLSELGPELVEESQSQYLRHAMNVWHDCVAGDGLRNPRLAVAAIDVISVLLDELPEESRAGSAALPP